MNIKLDRQLVSEIVIVLVVCVGGWIMLVERKITALHELEATIDQNTSQLMLADDGGIQRMAARLNGVRDRVRDVASRNRFAQDSSRLYGVVMDLAERHDVSVAHLDPGGRKGPNAPMAKLDVRRFHLTGEGTYFAVADFLGTVDQVEGFLRPVMLTVTPKRDAEESLVEFRFDCEAVSLELPQALAALLEVQDEQ